MSSDPFPPDTHRDLIRRLRSGDVRALEALYEAYYDRLVAFATALVHERERARDIVSEVFIAIWNGRSQLDVTTSLRSYLFGATRNRALNVRRSLEREHARYDTMLAGGEMPGMGDPSLEGIDGTSAQMAVGTALWDAVDRLNARARAVVILRWRAQLSHAAIAQTLGISEDAAKKIQRRALAALARMLPDLLDNSD